MGSKALDNARRRDRLQRNFSVVEAESTAEIDRAFRDAVDDYLAFCAEKGKEPEKSYKGSFNVRVNPDLHRAAALAAALKRESLDQFVADAIAAAL